MKYYVKYVFAFSAILAIILAFLASCTSPGAPPPDTGVPSEIPAPSVTPSPAPNDSAKPSPNHIPPSGGLIPDSAGGETPDYVSGGYAELIESKDALEIFLEDMEADVLDIETGAAYRIKRTAGDSITSAYAETLTPEDTERLLETAGGGWNVKRRAVVITVDGIKIAASITPFEHSGSEDEPYGEHAFERSGGTVPGINLDSIRGNGMVGVVDVFFFNSLISGVNIIDERHQEMVLKAYAYS